LFIDLEFYTPNSSWYNKGVLSSSFSQQQGGQAGIPLLHAAKYPKQQAKAKMIPTIAKERAIVSIYF